MKKILILLLAFYSSTALFSQKLELQALDSANYFDFWEGTWEGTWAEGPNEGKATNQLTWIAGGKVLQENFEVVAGQNKGFKGTSISVFRPRQLEWKQAWADNQGGYYDFIGKFEGNQRIFQTQPQVRNGQTIIQRMVFKDIEADAFTWDWELSKDGGKTWNLNWQIKYVRAEEG